MDISNLSKFPSNTRGYTVIPCFPLTPENMHESLLGLMVTIGLGSTERYVTDQGQLVGYDETQLEVKIGSKTKKFPYDPEGIQLQVYQFAHKIMFANSIPDKELATAKETRHNEPHGGKSEEEHTSIEFTKPKKEPVKKQRKHRKKKSSETATSNTKKSFFGIQRD